MYLMMVLVNGDFRSVTDTVVMTDRNDTLGADYVFTGNVDFSGANVTDANVAHLGGTETFTGNKTFSGDVVASANVDLTGAVVTATTQANTDAIKKLFTQYVDNRINPSAWRCLSGTRHPRRNCKCIDR